MRFSHESLPPLALGVTWSSTSETPPQYEQGSAFTALLYAAIHWVGTGDPILRSSGVETLMHPVIASPSDDLRWTTLDDAGDR